MVRQYNLPGQLTSQTVPGEVDIEYRFSATANDGRLWQRKDWMSGEEVTYQYDQLGRLIAAATTGPEWGQSYTYDGFGNLTQQAVTKGTAPSMSMAVDQNTNRLSGGGIAHDANGNMTVGPNGPLGYDVLNRVTSALAPGYGSETYLYSNRNERIVVRRSGQPDEVNFYGADGVLLGVYRIETRTDSFGSSNSSPVRVDDKERVYFGARLVAIGSTTMKRVFTDRLGSVVRKDTQSYRYYPYGQEVGGATTNDTPKFGTYTRDLSGLDYAMNRFYKNEWGRFTSPDPYQASGGVADPGSWNRYAYVQGDPVNFADPTGLDRWDPSTNTIYGDRSAMAGIAPAGGGGGAMRDAYVPDERAGYGEYVEPLSGGSYVLALPKVPAGNSYTPAQMRALTNGLNNALSHTDQADCATFYAGGDEDPSSTVAYILENTTYRLLSLPQGSGTGAQTVGQTDVHINTDGAFFNAGPHANGTVTVTMPNTAGVSTSFTFATMSTLQGFLLLHELGHQLGSYGADTNPAMNGANSQAVLDHCFRRDAQGIYH